MILTVFTDNILVYLKTTDNGINLILIFFSGLKIESFIGGLPLAEDKEKCTSCHVAVGTPGRVKQLINEHFLKTNSVKLFILDEADKLVEKSFLNDINEIYNSLPARKQLITTSATYPNDLEAFLSSYMVSPTFITVELNNPFLLGIKQFVKVVQECKNVVQQMKVKNETLIEILSTISYTQCLIFTNYQNRAESISNILNQKDWLSTYISAAQSQTKRLEAIDSLKKFKCRILLTTDLTARGIDASNVDLVINYDIPIDPVTYLHRMGRAGRYGSSGICINLACFGVDLLSLQKILGAIGGTTLSIPQLPKFTGTLCELLKMEIPEDKHIFGVVGDYSKLNIREEILTMKRINPSSKENDEGDNQNEEIKANKTGDIMKILKDTQDEVNVIRQHIADMSTDDILQSLASGGLNIGTEVKESENESEQCQPSNSNCPDLSTIKDILSSPLKRKSVCDTSSDSRMKAEVSNPNQRLQEKQSLLCKNKALFEVATILDNPDNAKQPKEHFLNNYLSILKNQESLEVSKLANMTDITDIFGVLENVENLQNIVEETGDSQEEVNPTDLAMPASQNLSNDLENIFQLGYDSIVKNDDGSFKNLALNIGESSVPMECMSSDRESTDGMEESAAEDTEPEIMKWVPVKKKSHGTKKKVKTTTSEVEIHDINTTSKEKAGTIVQDYSRKESFLNEYEDSSGYYTHGGATEDTEPDIMRWVPVKKKFNGTKKQVKIDDINTAPEEKTGTNAQDYKEIDYLNEYEDLSQYFTHCSHQLWQNGLRFTNVADFDNWFHYEWGPQVNAVRNYVQQNIYVQEMSKYHKNLNSKGNAETE